MLYYLHDVTTTLYWSEVIDTTETIIHNITFNTNNIIIIIIIIIILIL